MHYVLGKFRELRNPNVGADQMSLNVAIYFSAMLAGFLGKTGGVSSGDPPAATVLLGLAIPMMMALWVRRDSRISGEASLRVWGAG